LLLQDRAAWRDLKGRDATAVQHDKSAAMFGAKDARLLTQRRDDVFNHIVSIGIQFVVGHVHVSTVHEPDA